MRNQTKGKIMKPICIIALVLGIAGGGVAVYHLVETYPNVKAFSKRSETGGHHHYGHHRRGRRMDRLDYRLHRSYADAGFYQIYAMWALGGLGLILGVLGAAKAKEKFRYMAIAGAALSAVVLIISLSTQMASRLG
jgi:hypothetical protein